MKKMSIMNNRVSAKSQSPRKNFYEDKGSIIRLSAEAELNVIRDAHRILLKKHEDLETTKKDPNKQAKKELGDFINYTTVRSMLDEYLSPVLDQLPRIKN